MSALADLYPGHLVVNFIVIVAATVALVSVAAWIVSLLLERHPAIRHWVLLSALVASLASPLLAAAFVASETSFIALPLLAAAESPISAPGVRGNETPSADLLPLIPPEDSLPARGLGPEVTGPFPDNLNAAEVVPAALDRSDTETDPFRAIVVAVLLVWLCGTVVSIVGLARAGLFLRRLRRSLQPVSDVELRGVLDEAKRLVDARTAPTVMFSGRARMPMAAGLFRPVIVLPTELPSAISREQLCDVLMHEIAHIERLDNLIVLLQAIAKALFWPIPSVHLLNRQLGRAREEICDNHVLACRDAVNYGETLLRLAQLTCGAATPAGTVGIFHWRGKLEERIFGLIHKGRSKMTRTHPIIVLGILLLFLSASAILCATTILSARAGEQKQVAATQKPAGRQDERENGIKPGENDPALTVRPINAKGESVSLAYLTLWRALEPDEAKPVNQVNGPSGFGFYDPVIWEDQKHNARWIRAGSANPNDGRHGWEEKAFHFRSLKPGRYRVTAVTYRREAKTPDPTPWGVSDPYSYGGTTPVSIDVVLTEGNADFTVRIVDTETREPIPGLALRLRTASGVPIVHGHGNGNFFERTGDNGEVRYGHLKPGEFTVQLLGKLAYVNDFIQYEPVEKPVPVVVKRGDNSIEIAVDPRRLPQAEINKRFPFSVFGRVTDEAGNPMADVEVRAATGMGTLIGGGRTRTDSDGKYRLYFGPGYGRTRKDEDYAPLGIGVQAAHFYAEKLGWTLDAKDGYLFYLMTDQTPRQFEAMLKQEGGKYWGKDSAEEVVFASQPRELNFVLKHSRDATR